MKRFRYYILLLFLVNFVFVGKTFAFDDSNVISVKDYGAVGDGTTNDLEAIKSAINSCDKNQECTVFFPNGNYLVNDSIIISKSNVRLLGEGNSTLSFPKNINLEENGNRIVGVIVVKTVDQDISNVVVENLIVNANADSEHYGKELSLGRGITVYRQGKYPGTKNYYELNNVKIKNCTVKDSYGYGIAVIGSQLVKDGYSDSEVTSLNDSLDDDFDFRKYYTYYNIDNVVIEGCKISNSSVGVRLNRITNASLINNEVSGSKYENITLQVENGVISNNKVSIHNGGCGSICVDRSENLKILNNNIDETESNTKNLWKTGICQNSSAGPSYNIEISNNNINGAARGIWIKNHLKSANPHKKNDGGSRPGAGFIIRDNIITNSSITDIRIDELLDSKVVDGEFVGKSYLYNKYGNTINLEANDSYNGEVVGTNMKVEDNKNLVLVNPSKIIVSKVDGDGNYIVGDILQVLDINGNLYDTIVTSNQDVEIDLLLGEYILKDLSSNKEISFNVENDGGIKKKLILKIKNNNEKQKDVIDDDNKKESVVDVPKTLSNVSIYILIISTVLIIIGFSIFCYFLYNIKNKK